MAKLKAATRNKLPAKDFAGPGRSFPIEDKNHARAALSMVGRSSLSPAAKAKVVSRAKAKLGKDGDGDRDGGRGRSNMARGGMAHDGTMKGSNMHSDRTMRHERY